MQVRQIKGSSGFSLVEILVATTILLVIVVLVSMVFQQQSAAFQAGVDRTQGQSALRSVMGMVSRDLSLAVDSEDFIFSDKVFALKNLINSFVVTCLYTS